MHRWLRRLGSAASRYQQSDEVVSSAEPKTYNSDTIRLFDSGRFKRINQARLDHLAKLKLPLYRKSVLDIGSGPGDMAQFFVKRDCRVICVDGHEDNIRLMQERYPRLEGHCVDVQIPGSLDPYGPVDVVFCYGLLYHVENPLQVIRNIAGVCKELLLLETIICDSTLPVMRLADENYTATQALEGIGCRPSETFLQMALRRIGFQHVYRTKFKPKHNEFEYTLRNSMEWLQDGHPIRTILVASYISLDDNPNLIRFEV